MVQPSFRKLYNAYPFTPKGPNSRSLRYLKTAVYRRAQKLRLCSSRSWVVKLDTITCPDNERKAYREVIGTLSSLLNRSAHSHHGNFSECLECNNVVMWFLVFRLLHGSAARELEKGVPLCPFVTHIRSLRIESEENNGIPLRVEDEGTVAGASGQCGHHFVRLWWLANRHCMLRKLMPLLLLGSCHSLNSWNLHYACCTASCR